LLSSADLIVAFGLLLYANFATIALVVFAVAALAL
jgi:hypothetical protein